MIVAFNAAHSIVTYVGRSETEVSPWADKLRCQDCMKAPLKATGGNERFPSWTNCGATLAVWGLPRSLCSFCELPKRSIDADSVLKRWHKSLRRHAQFVRFAPGDHVVVIGAGPAGLTAAYVSRQKTNARVTVLEGDEIGRRHLANGPVQRLSLRHRRPPLLHEDRARSQRLWREILGDGVHQGSAAFAHFLQRQVLRLSAQADERAHGPRSLERVR